MEFLCHATNFPNGPRNIKSELSQKILFLVIFKTHADLAQSHVDKDVSFILIKEGSLHGTDCQRSYKELIIRVPLQDSHVNTAVIGDIRTSNPVCSDVSMAFYTFTHCEV